MFFNEITFSVITQHVDGALKNFPEVLQRSGFTIIELRETDIVTEATEEKIGEVYVWYCRGTKKNYLSFMKKHNYDEHLYEGRLSLW